MLILSRSILIGIIPQSIVTSKVSSVLTLQGSSPYIGATLTDPQGLSTITIVSLTTDSIGISQIGGLLLEGQVSLIQGQSVSQKSSVLSIPLGLSILGSILDPSGSVITTPLTSLSPSTHWIVESPSAGIITRLTISESLSTGVLSIDSIVPIGLGQRELIVGDRQTGKTSISTDSILNQKYNSRVSIYNSIGQKASNTLLLYLTLSRRNSISTTILVASSASSSSVSLYISPYSASSITEYFMLTSELSTFITYDDLTKQAMSYREIYLLLRRPPGREAYPGEIFFVHSRLLERSAKLNYNLGGGSTSSFPIVETLSGDVSSYITTNVISITDGQIFLSTDLFLSGIKPALDVGLSVTRVGSSSQWYGMKLLSGSYKLILAQYAELQAFSQFASEIQEETKLRLSQGNLLTELLKQPVGSVVSQQVSLSLLSFSNQDYFSKNLNISNISYLRNKVSIDKPWKQLYLGSRLSIKSILSTLPST